MKKLLVMVLMVSSSFADMSIVNYASTTTADTSIKKSFVTPQRNISRICWAKAEQTYGVPSKLLVAIAKVETNLKPTVISKPNKDGSYDIGLMQINSKWLSKLSRYNITERDLLEPCTNVMVGAWILSDNIQRLGYNWNAVGAYNAKTNWKRDIYAKKVHKAIMELGYNN